MAAMMLEEAEETEEAEEQALEVVAAAGRQ
jgi:hypothetical protein